MFFSENKLVKKNKYLAWFFVGNSLNETLSAHSFIIDKISENFEKIYIINLINLRFFSKSNNNFSFGIDDKLKLPKNIEVFCPLSIKEFKNFLNGKELIGICNFGRNFIDLKIHLILKFSKIKLVQISNIGNIQWSHKFLKTSLWTKIKFRLYKYYSQKLVILLSNLLLVPKIEIRFISNQKIINNIKANFLKNFLYKIKMFYAKELVIVNSRTYDIYKINKNEINENSIVLLDTNLKHVEDRMIGYIYTEEKAKQHYYYVTKLMDQLSKFYNKPIVVAVHPADNLESKKKVFPKFKVVKHETTDNIYKAFLVVFFDSSAIVDAILLNKRIITLTSKYIGNLTNSGSNKYHKEAGILQMKVEEELISNKEKLLLDLDNAKKNYVSFINKYIAPDGDNLGYKKIIETIKSRFFN